MTVLCAGSVASNNDSSLEGTVNGKTTTLYKDGVADAPFRSVNGFTDAGNFVYKSGLKLTGTYNMYRYKRTA